MPTSFDFAEKLKAAVKDDEPGSSQEPINLYSHLLDLSEWFEDSSATFFMRSADARKEDSLIRKIVDAGVYFINGMDSD